MYQTLQITSKVQSVNLKVHADPDYLLTSDELTVIADIRDDVR